MFGNLRLLMDLQLHKDNPDKLAEIFQMHREILLKLKEQYPEWRSHLKPEVLQELQKRGLPVD